MKRTEIEEFFAARDRAWQNHDAEALTACHTENGKLESPLWGKLQGLTAIRKSYFDWFATFPDTEYSSDYLLIDEQAIAQFIKLTGTQQQDFCGYPATGKQIQINGVSLCFLTGDRIDREVRRYDFTGFLLQLGVLKAKPSY
jgi:predicted ester cyclase